MKHYSFCLIEQEEQLLREDVRRVNKSEQVSIMPVYRFYNSRNGLQIIQPRMKSGNLKDLITSKERPRFEKRMKLAKQVVHCISAAHSLRPPLLNLDLRSSNVLLGEEMEVVVDGFAGVSKLRNLNTNKSLFYESFKYCSPEILTGESHDERSDVWSIGMRNICFFFMFQNSRLELFLSSLGDFLL